MAGRTVFSLACLLCSVALGATPPGDCRALIVSGDPGGEPNAAARFHDWTSRWNKLLRDEYGVKASNVRVLWSPAVVGKPEMANVPVEDQATLANVAAALSRLVQETREGDQAVLILVGHGYESEGIGKFCLPGKDLSDTEAGRLLQGLHGKQFICINAAPSSSPWAKSLSGPNRIIITATVLPGMGSQTYFSEFLLRALSPGGVTLLDAFNRASLNAIRWYQNQFVRKDSTLVHGREFQEIWKAMYPDRRMEPGGADPKEASNDPKDMAAWLGRRLIAEVAGLEDNGDGTPTAIYEEGKPITLLPAQPGGDGEKSRSIILGKP